MITLSANPMNPLYSSGTIGDMIVQALNRYPTRTAFIFEGRHYSYAEVHKMIGHATRWLDKLDLPKGTVVAQLSYNKVEQWCLTAALYIQGRPSLMLHPMGSLEDHDFVLNESRAQVLVMGPGFYERIATYQALGTNVRHFAAHEPGCGAPCMWEGLADAPDAPALVSYSDPEDIIHISFTGGTTGRPKGVLVSNRAKMSSSLAMLADKDWPDEVRVLLPGPISHGTGVLIVPTLCRGGTAILQNRFDKEQFLDAARDYRPTVVYLVPTMIYTLLDTPRTREVDWSSLQLLLYGASPISPTRIKEALQVFGPVLCQSYGQTETPASITVLKKADHITADERRLASCGMPLAGLQVRILDDACKPVPPGVVGEVCVRGPTVMTGYLNRPEETAVAFEGGWLHTGDLAKTDEQGYFYIVDRKKDMIISGGFNVYPSEIEATIESHPAVSKAAVFGIPDDKWGEAVMAVVIPRPGATVDIDEIKRYVRDRKGPVNSPKHLEVVEQLPLSAVGKTDKRKLREKYWSNRDRMVG